MQLYSWIPRQVVDGNQWMNVSQIYESCRHQVHPGTIIYHHVFRAASRLHAWYVETIIFFSLKRWCNLSFREQEEGYAWNPAVAPARKLEHTSLKTSMEPENTSMEKEKHLQNQQFLGCHFSGLFESWGAIGPCLGAVASVSLVIMVLQQLYIWGRRKFGGLDLCEIP